jgi:putative ABC transport system substrate-binding protein
MIAGLASKHQIPAMYAFRRFVDDGGLIAYGPDNNDQLYSAASYVDRVLKGEKPSDLPVQQPTKYTLVINLSAAKALGLSISPTLLARADEVINCATKQVAAGRRSPWIAGGYRTIARSNAFR